MTSNDPSSPVLAAYTALIDTLEPPRLGPKRRENVKSLIALETATNTLAQRFGLPDRNAALLRALVLLWHDHLEPAHAIVQEIPDADGSLIHAMMHRREPDFWNSKYWWRRVGEHPMFTSLAARATPVIAESAKTELSGELLPSGRWDPPAFVDFCQEASQASDSEVVTLAIELQRLEFEEVLVYLIESSQS